MITKNNTSTKENIVLFSEAPASWKTRFITPYGFACQLTLCDQKCIDVLKQSPGSDKLASGTRMFTICV